MQVTIVVDSLDALHLWKGILWIERWEEKYLPIAGGREADLYVRRQDTDAILAYLPDDLAIEAMEGWIVHADLPEELFGLDWECGCVLPGHSCPACRARALLTHGPGIPSN